MTLLMIGCGNMGGALLDGWLKAGLESATVVDPGLHEAPAKVRLLKSADDLGGERFDQIIIAVKPQLLDTVLPAYKNSLTENGVFISIAAGASLASIKKLINAPLVRVMPNLPAMIARGLTAICEEGASHEHIAQTEKLFQSNGSVIRVAREEDIDRFTAVAGSGPGYVFELLRCYTEASTKAGFDAETARKLVLETMIGSAEMALGSDLAFETLRNNVTSKAGTTEAGLNELRKGDDLETRFERTITAAFQRAKELGES